MNNTNQRETTTMKCTECGNKMKFYEQCENNREPSTHDNHDDAMESIRTALDGQPGHWDCKSYWECKECGHVDGENQEIITIDPDEPDCTDDDGHDWQSPEWLGGCSENPGIWGNGGGVIIETVCMICGCKKTTDTWAQDHRGRRVEKVSYDEGYYAEKVQNAE